MPKICPLCKNIIQDIIYLNEEDNTEPILNDGEEIDYKSNGEIEPINEIV